MLNAYINQHKAPFNQYLLDLIERESIPSPLKESMIYSLAVGGKRLRPILLFAVLDTIGIDPKRGYSVASALEMIHTYSLIHDDLPAMDNDDYRRGQLTNHKKFNEATAILAGDSLLTHAFKIVSEDFALTADQRLMLVSMLSTASGPLGMVAGQMEDMEAEHKQITIEELKSIHINKTGRLIEFAITAAGVIGEIDSKLMPLLQQFSLHLGLAFQIKDDILDVEGDSRLIGKTVGSDVENGKCTYVTLATLDGAKQMLERKIQSARSVLNQLPYDVSLLMAITDYIRDRQN